MQSELLNEWISEFVEEAKEKGRAESKTQVALKLLRKGHSPDYVAEIVDFPIEKVKKLADDTKR